MRTTGEVGVAMVGGRTSMVLVLGCATALLATACTDPPPVPGPQPTSVVEAPEPGPDQIVIGVDSIVGGYNPHTVADLSPVTRALGRLLLPSVFVPGSDGRLELDETVMRSAAVTSTDPFTVSYTIRPDASWSDGAPVAAEDFIYLAEAMRSQPGTIDPAGYRLITDIASREGGKRVEVTFADRYPGWRSLFSDLLPAHLLKDVPGGWQNAFASSFPAYGGPFAIKSIDTARGEILLERNERYWEKPAAVDQLVLRRSDKQGIIAALRDGNNQFALTRATGQERAALRRLGDAVTLYTVPRPAVAEVLLRPTSDVLSDDTTRAAIAALIDRKRLIAAGAEGGPSGRLRATAQLGVPSASGYQPTIPAAERTPRPQRMRELLRRAGYQRSMGVWRDASGDTLQLVVAAPREQEPYLAMARELVRQLTSAGIEAKLATPKPRELFGTDPADPDADPLAGGVGVDIVLAPRAVGADAASTFASRLACRERPGDSDGSANGTDGSENGDSDGADGDSSESADDGVVEPGNLAGFCHERLERLAQAVLTGERPLADVRPEVESTLWRADVTIPLFQFADTLAVGDSVAGVTPGNGFTGPFGDAVNWIRTGE
ncbi:ABC transporter family substrate-binding protein [Haloechinothrix halophila]|uniref:ABC transporter family substrate-binding protein n=1 Tax=Haloechinothrix halophila TaxID=1069073 RepID=UPI0038B382BB